MKRFLSLSLSLVIALILFLSIGIPVMAQGGVDVDIGIGTGGDANVDININSGGNTNVSVNGDGLATAAQVEASMIRGTDWDLFTDLEVRRLSKRSFAVDELLGLLTDGLALNILSSQEGDTTLQNQLTVLGFEQDSQDFLITLNQDNIASLGMLIKGLDTRCVELEQSLSAHKAYTTYLVNYYSTMIQEILLIAGLLSIIGIGLLVYLLYKVKRLPS